MIFFLLPNTSAITVQLYALFPADPYSKNCFILNWIIQKSWLTSKLTKVNITLEEAMKAQRESRGIAQLFP
jgi:hypothetical protein